MTGSNAKARLRALAAAASAAAAMMLTGTAAYAGGWTVSIPTGVDMDAYSTYLAGDGGVTVTNPQDTVAVQVAPADGAEPRLHDYYQDRFFIEYGIDGGAFTVAPGASGEKVPVTFSSLARQVGKWGHDDYAVYDIAAYDPATHASVQFDPCGGTAVPRMVYEKGKGQKYGTLPVTERAGHEFLGWFTARDGGDQVSPEDEIGDRDVTLYAHWQAGTVAVSYYFEDDYGENRTLIETRSIALGGVLGPWPKPKNSGEHYSNWHTPNGRMLQNTSVLMLSDTDDPDAAQLTATVICQKDVDAIVQGFVPWYGGVVAEENEDRILVRARTSFTNVNGSDMFGFNVYNKYYTFGNMSFERDYIMMLDYSDKEKIEETGEVPEKKYDFAQSSREDTDISIKGNNSSTMSKSAFNGIKDNRYSYLYAHSQTDGHGREEEALPKLQVTSEKEAGFSELDRQIGYQWKGWALDIPVGSAADKKYGEGDLLTDESVYSPDKDVARGSAAGLLFGRWDFQEYTITFDLNTRDINGKKVKDPLAVIGEGTTELSDEPYKQTFFYKCPYGKPNALPTYPKVYRPDWEFKGWYLDPGNDKNGRPLTDDTIARYPQDIIAYAHWEKLYQVNVSHGKRNTVTKAGETEPISVKGEGPNNNSELYGGTRYQPNWFNDGTVIGIESDNKDTRAMALAENTTIHVMDNNETECGRLVAEKYLRINPYYAMWNYRSGASGQRSKLNMPGRNVDEPGSGMYHMTRSLNSAIWNYHNYYYFEKWYEADKDNASYDFSDSAHFSKPTVPGQPYPAQRDDWVCNYTVHGRDVTLCAKLGLVQRAYNVHRAVAENYQMTDENYEALWENLRSAFVNGHLYMKVHSTNHCYIHEMELRGSGSQRTHCNGTPHFISVYTLDSRYAQRSTGELRYAQDVVEFYDKNKKAKKNAFLDMDAAVSPENRLYAAEFIENLNFSTGRNYDAKSGTTFGKFDYATKNLGVWPVATTSPEQKWWRNMSVAGVKCDIAFLFYTTNEKAFYIVGFHPNDSETGIAMEIEGFCYWKQSQTLDNKADGVQEDPQKELKWGGNYRYYPPSTYYKSDGKTEDYTVPGHTVGMGTGTYDILKGSGKNAKYKSTAGPAASNNGEYRVSGTALQDISMPLMNRHQMQQRDMLNFNYPCVMGKGSIPIEHVDIKGQDVTNLGGAVWNFGKYKISDSSWESKAVSGYFGKYYVDEGFRNFALAPGVLKWQSCGSPFPVTVEPRY